MSKQRKLFITLLTRRFIIITCFIFLIIACLSSILFFVSLQGQQKQAISSMMNRQSLVIQTVTKEVNRKYVIMQAIRNNANLKYELSEKMDKVNLSLKASQKEINSVLDELDHNIIGIMDIDTLRPKHIHNLWDKFNECLESIVNNNQINEQTNESLIFINENNEQLLKYAEDTMMKLLDDKTMLVLNVTKVFIVLFFVFITFLIVFIFQLYKYIVIPLNAIYKGMTNWKLNSNVVSMLPKDSKLRPFVEEIYDRFEKLNKLISLIKNMNSYQSFSEILEFIYNSFSVFIPYSHIGIALLKDDGKTLEASYGISAPSLSELPKKLVGIKADVSNTSLGEIIEKGTPRVINDLDKHLQDTSKKDYNSIILQAGIKSSITLPLNISKRPVGVIFFSSKIRNIYTNEHIQILETLADSIAISLNQNIFIDELLYSSILALAKLAESRDEDTGDHIERIGIYSEKLSELLLIDDKFLDTITHSFIKDIRRFAPLHDIGKVGIKDSILLKPGKLTYEEFEEMKSHTTFGAEVLKAANKNISKQGKRMFDMGIEIAEFHQEKWNGSGYPYGKRSEEIPLSARIVAVVDVFDALTSRRPYKKAFPFEESFSIVAEGSGTHFDPEIISTLIKHKQEFYDLYMEINHN